MPLHSAPLLPARPLSPTLLLAALATASPVSLAGEPFLSTHRWWNPDAAPVSGNFGSSANWDGFDLPITDGSWINELILSEFDSPADFIAENNLQSGLPVGRLRVGSLGTTTQILGLPLTFRRYNLNAEQTEDATMTVSGDVIIRAPLRGSAPVHITISGTLVLDPSGTGPHDFSGGFIQNGFGVLEVDRGSALGSLSNSFTLISGTFRATDSFTMAIPLSIPDHDGTQVAKFNTPSGVRLTLSGALSGEGEARKTGPGTLVATGDGSGAGVLWRLDDGRVEVSGTGMGAASILVPDEGVPVQLIGDATLGGVSGGLPWLNDPLLELNGHTLTLTGFTSSQAPTTGPGTVRVAEGATTRILSIPDSIDSGYTLHAEGTVEFDDTSTYAHTPFAALVIGPNGLVTKQFFANEAAVGTGTLAGSGRLETSRFRFGGDGSSGTYAGVLENTSLCVKQGAGTYTLSGDNDITGDVLIEGGVLAFASPASVGTPAEIEIEPGAELNLPNGSGVGRIIGGGTLQVAGIVTLGEDGSDSDLAGPVFGTPSSTLRKRGEGTLTIGGDTAGFQGFFDVLGGTAVIEGVSLVPNGYVSVNGLGTLRGHGEIASSLLVQNLLAVTPGETLRLTGTDKRNFALFEAPATGVLAMDDVTVMQDGNGVYGTIRADGGTVALGDSTEITDGTVEAVNGGAIELAGQAVVRNAVVNGSITRPAGGGLEIDNAGITVPSGGTLSMILDAGDTGPTAVIHGLGTCDLAGTLHLEFADGFTPATGDRFRLIGGDAPAGITVTGSFETLTAPDLAPNVLRVSVTPAGVEAVATCAADLTEPYGILDLSDVNTFVSAFVTNEPLADLNGDGFFDLSDINAFITTVVVGCP